jgi:hypothetical protein
MTVDESHVADLIARRKTAEKVVEGMPDGVIKEKAFELAFQHLLAADGRSVSTRPRRAKTTRKTGRESSPAPRRKGASGPRRHLTALVQQGFFDEWKGLPDIVQGLQARGHSYRQEDLSKPLQRMTQAGTLRRQQKDRERGRTIWVYRRYELSGNGSN